MLLQSAPILAKKLLVDEKIAACVKQICLQLLFVKFRIEKKLSGETFCFLEKRLLSKYLNVVLRVTYCFLTSCLLAHNQLSRSLLLFSCNLIGQLCLSGPGYSSRAVK